MGAPVSLQVFKVNDCEWWAGRGTPEALLAAYMKATGCAREEATGDDPDLPCALSALEMEQLKFVLDDHGDRLTVPLTFRERLAGMEAAGAEFPCFFATSEW